MFKIKVMGLVIALLLVAGLSFATQRSDEIVESAVVVDYTGGPYEFPVTPETPEWLTLKSHPEMIKAIQIPDEILFKMSTEALVETCMNYPLYGDFMLFNNQEHGFSVQVARLNGIKELLQRPDAGKHLINEYNSPGRALDIYISEIDKGNRDIEFRFKNIYLEMFLSRPAIFYSLTQEEEKNLLSRIVANIDTMKSRPDVFSSFGLLSKALILKGVLEKNGYKREESLTAANVEMQIDIYIQEAIKFAQK